MKRGLRVLFVLATLVYLPSAFSESVEQQIKQQAIDFYKQQIKTTDFFSTLSDDNCRDRGRGSCVRTLCQYKNCSAWGEEVAKACVGSNGTCVEELCKQKNCSAWGFEVAAACKGSSGRCVRALCKHKNCSAWGFEVAEACIGADGGCVEAICENKNCDAWGFEVAKSCGGRGR